MNTTDRKNIAANVPEPVEERQNHVIWEELWRGAGEPQVEGLVMVSGFGRSDVPAYARRPDWSHPMTEFAMMCAAEEAAGKPLWWSQPDAPGHLYWQAGCDVGVFDTAPTRIECALRVIIACKKENQ